MNKLTQGIGAAAVTALVGGGIIYGEPKLADRVNANNLATKLATLNILAEPIRSGSAQEIKCSGNDTLLPASEYRIVQSENGGSYYLVDNKNKHYWSETCDLVQEVE